MGPTIGIDLGTTNSLIAVFEGGAPRLLPNALGNLLTPSVVGLDDNGTLVVGETAKRRLVSHPDQTHALFKRQMGTNRLHRLGRKDYRAEDLSALVLRTLKADAEEALGQVITEAVVSVPAYFNETQRRAVHNACALAGMKATRLINEPTAAALAYGLQDREDESTFLVFDLGGGTFDVSILEMFEGVMEVKSTAGDAFLGGEDFTDTLAKHLGEALKPPLAKTTHEHKAQLRTAADAAKLALSSAHETTVSLNIGDSNLDQTVTRDTFEEINKPTLARLRKPVERALHDANLRIADLDRVVLVGGATRMPVVRSLIARQLQRLPEGTIDPDHVVALGAAVQAGLAARDAALEDVVMTDVSAFTLGIETTRESNGTYHHGFYLPVIERNSTVPISREEVVHSLVPGQKSLTIAVYQGEAPMVVDNVKLGQFELAIPYNPKETESAAIRFTYDVSGLLEVEGRSLSTGKSTSIVIQSTGGTLSDREIKARLKQLESLKVHPRDQAENQHMLARLGEAYAMARGAERDYIQNQLARFQTLIEQQDDSEIAEAMTELDQFLTSFEQNYVR